MSYDLSKLKLNGTSLGTVDGIKLNGQILTGLLGIKLNNEIVISFSTTPTLSYDECGPGLATLDDGNVDTLLVSDVISRLDTLCSLDTENGDICPYIPYRGIAGAFRAAVYAKDPKSIVTDMQYESYDPLTSYKNAGNLTTTGSFGYPWDQTTFEGPNWQAPSAESVDYPDERLREQLEPTAYASGGDWSGPEKIFVSNYEADVSKFDATGAYTGNLSLHTSYTPASVGKPVLYDRTGQVGGIYNCADAGGAGSMDLNIFTYDHAELWYMAGKQAAEYNAINNGILFVGVDDFQISMFLKGVEDNAGTHSIDLAALFDSGKIKKTGLTDTTQLASLMAEGFDETNPTTWKFKQDFGFIVTTIGLGTIYNGDNLPPIFQSVFYQETTYQTYASQLWFLIANTANMHGMFVGEFPSLQEYSYMNFDGTYKILGPVSRDVNPYDISSYLDTARENDYRGRLHEIFPDFSSLVSFVTDSDNTFFGEGGVASTINYVGTLNQNGPSTVATTDTYSWGEFAGSYDSEHNVFTAERQTTLEDGCTYKGADIPSLSA